MVSRVSVLNPGGSNIGEYGHPKYDRRSTEECLYIDSRLPYSFTKHIVQMILQHFI